MRVTVPAEPIEFGGPATVLNDLWPIVRRSQASTGKFTDPLRTAAGEERASVALDGLETLWCNTGTLCNIACENCYIESSPRNDRLVYITRDEIDPRDPARLVLFPEMDAQADVPEISSRCWHVLGKSPQDVMCASSRMVVKRKGAARPCVVACTLLPYDAGFELGRTLAEASGPVRLNHPHCARFCVLGQASCSV